MTHWRPEEIHTAFEARQFPPPECPEVVFVGRSNVGKSTLINTLLNRRNKKVAYVSSKPGKTRSVNFYKISAAGEGRENFFRLVDMPGYGYSARSSDERKRWWSIVNDYFAGERDVSFVAHLIDFRHGPLAGDAKLTEWLDALDMPRLVIFTKGDKVPNGRRNAFYGKYVSGLVSVMPPVITRGKNDDSAEDLRRMISVIIREPRG